MLWQGREGKSLELENAWWEAGHGVPPWTKREFPWLDEGSKTRSNAWFEAHPALGRTGPELPFELIPSHLVCPDQLLQYQYPSWSGQNTGASLSCHTLGAGAVGQV